MPQIAVKEKNQKASQTATVRLRIVLLIILALHFVFLALSSRIPSHSFLFLFYFISMVLIPGFIFTGRIKFCTNISLRVLMSFVVGTSLFYLILLIFAIFRLDIRYIGLVVPIIALVPLLTDWSGRTTNFLAIGGKDDSPIAVSRRHTAVLLFLMVVVSFLILSVGDNLGYTSDSPDHIAYIRTISRSNAVFPQQFLYSEGGALTRDIRKGLGHAMWGTLNTLTGRHAFHPVWGLVSLISSVFVLLALYCTCILLFGSSSLGLVSAVLFLLYYHKGLRGHQLITVAYAFPTGKIFFLVFLSCVPLYLNKGRNEHLVLAALSSFAATGTHIAHFLLCGFILLIFSLIKVIDASSEERKMLLKRRVPMLLTLFVMVNLSYLVLRYLRDYSPNNIIHTHVQGALLFSDKLYVLNPFSLIGTPLHALSFVSLFILWRQSRREVNLKLLLWGRAAVLILLLNPLWFPFLMSRVSYLVMRLNFAVPSIILAACLVTELWKWLRGSGTVIPRKACVVSLIAVVSLLGYPLVKTPRGFAYTRKKLSGSLRYSCRNLNDLYETINRTVPAGSIIASDPITSYSIPAFTDQFVVCTYDQHSIPNDSTALDRILDCRDIYNPEIPLADVAATLKKYDVRYIVMNGRIPPYISSLYWRPDSRSTIEAARRFSQAKPLFEVLSDTNDVALFRFSFDPDFDYSSYGYVTPEYLGPVVDPEGVKTFSKSGIEAVYIKEIVLSREKVQRGDTVQVEIEWVSCEGLSPGSYIVVLRFDSDFKKGVFYSSYYGKIYRNIHEIIKGARFRFSVGHLPLKGLYPPDKWPANMIVKDRIVVSVPGDVSPGVYSVSVKMFRGTQYPNYTLGDIFMDADSYQGVVMGRITVQ